MHKAHKSNLYVDAFVFDQFYDGLIGDERVLDHPDPIATRSWLAP